MLGSNRGDRADFISKAIVMIGETVGSVVTRSSLYESDPWGFEDEIQFLNQVIVIDTTLAPEDLLEQLLTIETKLGRIRPFEGCGCSVSSSTMEIEGDGKHEKPIYSGRTIDLDILFYGQQLVFTDKLMIPHPRLHERRFVLVPLTEISPAFVHPLLKKTISALLRECRDLTKVTALTF